MGNGAQPAADGESISTKGGSDPAPAAVGASKEEAGEARAGVAGGVGPAGGEPLNSRRQAFAQVCTLCVPLLLQKKNIAARLALTYTQMKMQAQEWWYRAPR